MTNITFSDNRGTKLFMLGLLNKTINKDDLIIDADNKRPVLTKRGETINIQDFGGFRNGSEIFFKNDYVSILEDLQDRGQL